MSIKIIIFYLKGCWHVGRKDNLYRHVTNLKRRFPNDVEFIPNTYLLASDWERFKLKK